MAYNVLDGYEEWAKTQSNPKPQPNNKSTYNVLDGYDDWAKENARKKDPTPDKLDWNENPQPDYIGDAIKGAKTFVKNNVQPFIQNAGNAINDTVTNIGNAMNDIQPMGQINFDPQKNLITGGGVNFVQPTNQYIPQYQVKTPKPTQSAQPDLKVTSNVLNNFGNSPLSLAKNNPMPAPTISEYQPKPPTTIQNIGNAAGGVISDIGDSAGRMTARFLDNLYKESEKVTTNPKTGEKHKVNDINMISMTKALMRTLDPAQNSYADINPAHTERQLFGSQEDRQFLHALERGDIKAYSNADFDTLQANATKNIESSRNEIQNLLNNGQISAKQADELYKKSIDDVQAQTKGQYVDMLQHNFNIENKVNEHINRVERNAELANKTLSGYMLAETGGLGANLLNFGGKAVGEKVTQAATKKILEGYAKKEFINAGLNNGLSKEATEALYKQIGKEYQKKFAEVYAQKGLESIGLEGAKKTAAEMGINAARSAIQGGVDLGVLGAASNAATNNTALVDTGVSNAEAFEEGAKEGLKFGAGMSVIPYAGKGAAKLLGKVKIKGKAEPYYDSTAVTPYVEPRKRTGFTMEDSPINNGARDFESIAPKTAAKQNKTTEQVTEQAIEPAVKENLTADNNTFTSYPQAFKEMKKRGKGFTVVNNNDGTYTVALTGNVTKNVQTPAENIENQFAQVDEMVKTPQTETKYLNKYLATDKSDFGTELKFAMDKIDSGEYTQEDFEKLNSLVNEFENEALDIKNGTKIVDELRGKYKDLPLEDSETYLNRTEKFQDGYNPITNQKEKLREVPKIEEQNQIADSSKMVEPKQEEVKAPETTELKETNSEQNSAPQEQAEVKQPETKVSKKVSQIAPKTAEKQAKKQAEKANTKYEDYGEKIEGARKDIWQAYKEKFNRSLPETYEEFTSAKLSDLFPDIDGNKFIEAGGSEDTAAVIKLLRDSIPTKPSGSKAMRQYYRDNWTKKVQEYRDYTQKLLNGEMTADEAVDKLVYRDNMIDYQIRRKADAYRAVGYPACKNIKDYELNKGEVWAKDGGKQEKWSIIKGNRYINAFDTREEAVNYLKEIAGVKKTPAKKEAKLEIGRWNDERRANGYIIYYKAGTGKYIELKNKFETAKDARDYLTEHKQELLEQLSKMKEEPPMRGEVNEPRVGKGFRKGKNVSPEEFSKTFGFRGVQFGNYVEGNKRVEDINNAYDSLMDMAEVLHLPEKAISLNGELGLAFGARGTGGKHAASAHYEPLNVVINLTKKKGAGSLAHEWWHSLDNYFGKKNKSEMATNAYNVNDPQFRQEMFNAYSDVKKAVREAIYSRSKKLDETRTKDYWSTDEEMTARAFESYIKHKIEKQGFSNDYLANIIGEKAYEDLGRAEAYPYPKKAEMDNIEKAFDNFFNTIKTRETDKGVELYSPDLPTFMENYEKAIRANTGVRDLNLNPIRAAIIKGINGNELADLLPDGISDFVRNNVGNFKIKPTDSTQRYAAGSIRGEEKTIKLNIKAIGNNPRKFITTLAHEIQHHLQEKRYNEIMDRKSRGETLSQDDKDFIKQYNNCIKVNEKLDEAYNKNPELINDYLSVLGTNEEGAWLAKLNKEDYNTVDDYRNVLEKQTIDDLELEAEDTGVDYGREYTEQSKYKEARLTNNKIRFGEWLGRAISQYFNRGNKSQKGSEGTSFKRVDVPKTNKPETDTQIENKTDKDIEADNYAKNINIQKNVRDKEKKIKPLNTFEQIRDDVVTEWKKMVIPMDTVLGTINPQLKTMVRKNAAETAVKLGENLKKAKTFIDGVKKLNEDDWLTLDLALKNSDTETINKIISENNLSKEYQQIKDLLEDTYIEATSAGLEMGHIPDYFPRQVKKGQEGRYMKYLEQLAKGEDVGLEEALFSKEDYDKTLKALREKPDYYVMSAEDKAKFINNTLRGYWNGIGARPANIKNSRKIKQIDAEMNAFYEDSITSLVNYITSTQEAIGAKRFFGGENVEAAKLRVKIRHKAKKLRENGGSLSKEETVELKKEINSLGKQLKEKLGDDDNIDNSIGKLVLDLKQKRLINSDEEKLVKDLLKARFAPAAMPKFLKTVRDFTYGFSMPAIQNAITQIGDNAFTIDAYGIENWAGGIDERFKINKEDLGITDIAHEFSDPSFVQKYVKKLFTVNGLSAMDGFGKNTSINASLHWAQDMIEAKDENFNKRVKDFFGDKAEQVKQDIMKGNITTEVKELAYDLLADLQPIGANQEPYYKAKGGASSFFYTLRTYGIKAIDIARNKVTNEIKDGVKTFKEGNKKEGKAKIIKALKAGLKLQLLLTLFNMGKDAINDFLSNREFDSTESLIDSLIPAQLVSRFTANKVYKKLKNPNKYGSESWVDIAANYASPSVGAIKAGYDFATSPFEKDIKIKAKKAYSATKIPVVGRPAYDWWIKNDDKKAYGGFKSPLAEGFTPSTSKVKLTESYLNGEDKTKRDKIRAKMAKDGISAKDIEKIDKEARNEVRRKYRDDFVGAIEARDKDQVYSIARDLRKKGLSKAEIDLIYAKAKKKAAKNKEKA